MGTKRSPGAYDCHANAHPDEPMFVLLGRDPQAPSLVRDWARARLAAGEDTDKVSEALRCAEHMDEYRADLDAGLLRQPSLDVPELGSWWRHHESGAAYEVYDVTNVGSDRPKFRPTVSYRDADGRRFSRALELWHGSFERIGEYTYGPPGALSRGDLVAMVREAFLEGVRCGLRYQDGSLAIDDASTMEAGADLWIDAGVRRRLQAAGDGQ